MAEFVIYRDGVPMAFTSDPYKWIHDRHSYSADHARQYEGYSWELRKSNTEPYGCAGCGLPIADAGKRGLVTITTGRESAVTVSVHDDAGCRKRARVN